MASEARWVLFGMVGLAGVAAAAWFLQPAASDAVPDLHASIDVPTQREPPIDPMAREAPAPNDVTAAPVEIAARVEAVTETPEPTPTPEPPPAQDTIAADPAAPIDPMAVYTGRHKLGVNRVTDMARIGNVSFSRRQGQLYLQGRVQRGQHWLDISGTVDAKDPKTFVLDGSIKGVPDMAWNGEAPRERSTQGRFTFRVKNNRPYWRLYEVNGRDCVCWDNCGNDFCYIDIERQPAQ